MALTPSAERHAARTASACSCRLTWAALHSKNFNQPQPLHRSWQWFLANVGMLSIARLKIICRMGCDSPCAQRGRLVYYATVAHMVELADTLL